MLGQSDVAWAVTGSSKNILPHEVTFFFGPAYNMADYRVLTFPPTIHHCVQGRRDGTFPSLMHYP